MEQILIISSVLLWIVVLFNFVLTFALIRRMKTLQSFDPMNVKGLDIGEPAPNFVALTVDNQEVNLATYRGKSVAFIFVAPHCQPCHEIVAELHSVALKAKSQGVELILVNDADVAQTQDFVKELNITLPILAAPRQSNPFMDNFKVAGTPFYCLLDAEGKVSATGFLVGTEWQIITKKWEMS